MVLKLVSGDTSNYFEGVQIQVSLVDKVDADTIHKAADLDWNFRTIDERLTKSHVAHITGKDAAPSYSIMFDTQAYIMENGKTIDRIPHVSEII